MTLPKTSTQTISIISSDSKRGAGTIEIIELSTSNRIVRSCLRGISLLILSIFMLAVPLLHFILVPLGLILTLVVFYSAFQVKQIIIQGSAECPSCNKTIKINKRKYKLPFSDVCEHCGRQLTIK